VSSMHRQRGVDRRGRVLGSWGRWMESGAIFHTYSTYARGLDILIGAYNFLDLVPKGRDEEGLPHGMAWVRHHDRYDVG
jgi:predicted dithiol-disulfide oxidoreductase (DUF899 family)